MAKQLHPALVAKIDTGALLANIQDFKAHTKKKPQIWAVVKADAYGLGAVLVAQTIQAEVDGFCVSNLAEALELRAAQISKPVLVLSVIHPLDAALAAEQDIRLCAPSLEWLTLVAQTERPQESALKIHLAVDSGMGRLGVQSAAEANAMLVLAQEHGIEVEGIFTHFATADDGNEAKFVEQEAMFSQLLSELTSRPKYVHSSNSGAGLWHGETIRDIERLGILVYGFDPSDGLLPLPYALHPALTLETKLLQIKQFKAGESVGYGAGYVATGDEFIGVIGVGYADGWPREMAGFHVLVEGQECEILDPVSMNMSMIKLDKAYPYGTKVTLIGENAGAKITVEEVAAWRHTISTEVSSQLGKHIPRIAL